MIVKIIELASTLDPPDVTKLFLIMSCITMQKVINVTFYLTRILYDRKKHLLLHAPKTDELRIPKLVHRKILQEIEGNFSNF